MSQRLTGADGMPTLAARLGVAGLMLVGAASAYAAGPGGGEPSAPAHHPVAASRLAGELPIAAPERAPALGSAAAVPPLVRSRGSRRAPAPQPAATPEPTPPAAELSVSEPLPEPTPAATPVPTPVAAPPALPPAAPPKPRSTPAPTFDSSG